ncbi:peptide ABC transporter ATP-binding protein, partial [Micromonospora sp. NPDC051141]
WKAQDVCAQDVPLLQIRPGSDHPSACHFAEKREIVVTHEVA